MYRATGGFPTLLAALACGASSLTAQERPVVVVDAGHGGAEVGTQGADIVEKQVTLRAAFTVAERFVEAGYDVRMTRSGDYALSWEERAAVVSQVGAVAFISLHVNQDDDESVHGVVMVGLRDNDDTRALVSAVERQLATRRIGFESRHVDITPLQGIDTAALLIEIGYLSHPVERRIVTDRAYHARLAGHLVSSIDQLLGTTR